MKIYLGTDHRGVELQQEIVALLEQEGIPYELSSLPHNPEDDYSDFAFEISKKVVENKDSFGLLICGSGIGMSIAANKVKGIRCARILTAEEAYKAKDEDGANVLAIPASLSIDTIKEMIYAYIDAPYCSKEKYVRRTEKVIAYEQGKSYEL